MTAQDSTVGGDLKKSIPPKKGRGKKIDRMWIGAGERHSAGRLIPSEGALGEMGGRRYREPRYGGSVGKKKEGIGAASTGELLERPHMVWRPEGSNTGKDSTPIGMSVVQKKLGL